MQVFLLPFLILRLSLINLVFFIKVFLIKKELSKPLILFLCLILIILTSFGYISINKKNNLSEHPSILRKNTLISTENHKTYQIIFSEDAIRAEIKKYEDSLNEQPQQRDVLINLAILYNSVDDFAQAQAYLTQAKALDPNNELFLSINQH